MGLMLLCIRCLCLCFAFTGVLRLLLLLVCCLLWSWLLPATGFRLCTFRCCVCALRVFVALDVWFVGYCLLGYLCLVFNVDLCFCGLVLLVPVSFLGFGLVLLFEFCVCGYGLTVLLWTCLNSLSVCVFLLVVWCFDDCVVGGCCYIACCLWCFAVLCMIGGW